MLLKNLIPLMTSYYEVKDLKKNLLYTAEYYISDYDYCEVKDIHKAEGFDGRPCIRITIERGVYGA